MSYIASYGRLTPVTANFPLGFVSPSKTAIERCLAPQPCPQVPNLVEVPNINGVPFEMVRAYEKDPITGLQKVPPNQRRIVTLAMVPESRNGLGRFVGNMTRFHMPIEAILTNGAYFCRCIWGKGLNPDKTRKGSNKLSDHSLGQAVDIAGVRWRLPVSGSRGPGDPPGRVRETIVLNFEDAGERSLLRRIDASLRLAFPNVIDYWDKDHHDHFHCDLSTGPASLRNTIRFTQEILRFLRNRLVAINGELDMPTKTALQESFGWNRDPGTLKSVLELLFTGVASGRL